MHSAAFKLSDDQTGWGPHGVDYNATGANDQSPVLTSNGDDTYSITFTPGEFYGVPEGETISQLSAVFNGGSWDNEGKDYVEGECGDFYIPLYFESGEPSFAFKLNMQKMYADGNFDPADPVYVEVEGFDAIELIDLDASFETDRIYEGVLEEGLTVDQVYEVKFRYGDDNYETSARSMTAIGGKSTLDVWWNDEGLTAVTLVVNMAYQIAGQVSSTAIFDPATDYLDVAGNFNGWDGANSHLTAVEGSDSLFTITVEGVEAGSTMEYKFRINGDWDNSEFAGGGANRLYVVPEGESTVNHIYDNFWPGRVPVTFNVNMTYQIDKEAFVFGTDFVDVAGDMNGWNGASDVLAHVGDSVYSKVILLEIGTSYGFKFRINGSWSLNEFPGSAPNRTYVPVDTVGGVTNIIDVWYNDDNPAVAKAPVANNVEIEGVQNPGVELTGVYEYEDVNGDAEGTSTYRWLIADTDDSSTATAIDGETTTTYTVTETDLSKYIFFEVTPIASASTPNQNLLEGEAVVSAGLPIFGVSVEGISEHKIIVYPNPFNEIVTVDNLDNVNTIMISNIIGQEMMNIRVLETSTMEINTSDFRTGVYFISFIGNDGSMRTTKIIKR
jgi:type IX secretion system substrate protein